MEAAPRLAISGLTKSFGGVHALRDVDLTVASGEIHGLLGTNGSGKSTLIKVLAGVHAPDAGRLEVDGRQVSLPLAPGEGERHGLAFVHQNLALLPEATVIENLIAGDRRHLGRWHIDWAAQTRRARALFEKHGLRLDPRTPVEDLTQVQRAEFAIVRAADRLADTGGVLVLDEPTPFLPLDDVRELFGLMRRLAGQGVSIVFVSHDIDEILEITERATILRDGCVVSTFVTRNTPRDAIVRAIVGSDVAGGRVIPAPVDTAPVRVRVEDLTSATLSPLSFEVRAGEVLGLTGLLGSGYDEVPYLLAGARSAAGGQLTVDGQTVAVASVTPARAKRDGIVLIPGDRQKAGLALDISLAENAMLPLLGKSRTIHPDARNKATRVLMDRFGVKARHPAQAAGELSGGNQQKLVLGKWFQLGPRLVLLDEPTQGIDVGARREIFERIAELCASGTAVICATSEFDQLEAIAHRVLVFDRGRIKTQLKGDHVAKQHIAEACYQEDRVHDAI
ncbi:sugar ABC transporter ATP-binding protein [Paracoccus suum]|uniref:sugar ABC transporter ATP-binding protein n=1 Tax=Paracoccus suum TaxID=2259340 RepID=UPI0013B05557|nr:sugar ABC transporter ATP-binding protein [Paracoccus suum]